MNPGWNCTRRNRNIGTEKQGYSKNNKLVIPWALHDERVFWEKLCQPVKIKKQINNHEITFFVEPTQTGFYHACTIEDIEKVLSFIPKKHIQEIDIIVLRQPKKKEIILQPCWGRLAYWAVIGKCESPAIFIEAQNHNGILKWSKSVTPEKKTELARLEQDGYKIELTKRNYVIHQDIASVRNTQLYRTLPHEIGHYVDYLVNVLEPSRKSDDNLFVGFSDLYDAKPVRDKEIFAHRYADEFRKRMLGKNIFPFKKILNESKMLKYGLQISWFQKTKENLQR